MQHYGKACCSKHHGSSCIHRGEETALEQPAGGRCDNAADSGVAADVSHLLQFLWRPPPPVAAHRAPAAAALAAARRPPSAARPPWSTPAASHPGRKAEQMTSPCHSAVAVKAMVQASKKVVVRSVRLACCSVHTVDTALPEAQGGNQAALQGGRLRGTTAAAGCGGHLQQAAPGPVRQRRQGGVLRGEAARQLPRRPQRPEVQPLRPLLQQVLQLRQLRLLHQPCGAATLICTGFVGLILTTSCRGRVG